MQNIQVLIRSSKKQIEEVEDTHRRLLRHQLELKKQIENLETEKKDVMDKEQIRLEDEDTDMSHARFEQQKHEIQSANYALKTSINHRLTKREEEKYEVDKSLGQAKQKLNQIRKN